MHHTAVGVVDPEPIGIDIHIFTVAGSDKLKVEVKHQNVQTEVVEARDLQEGMLPCMYKCIMQQLFHCTYVDNYFT